MDSKELTKIIYSALDDKKGENIKILDISKRSEEHTSELQSR